MERGSSPLSILINELNAVFLTAINIITLFHEPLNPENAKYYEKFTDKYFSQAKQLTL